MTDMTKAQWREKARELETQVDHLESLLKSADEEKHKAALEVRNKAFCNGLEWAILEMEKSSSTYMEQRKKMPFINWAEDVLLRAYVLDSFAIYLRGEHFKRSGTPLAW